MRSHLSLRYLAASLSLEEFKCQDCPKLCILNKQNLRETRIKREKRVRIGM